MKRHPLAVFFTLAFLLPWFVWGTTLAQQSGLIGWHIPESLAFWLGLPIATYGAAALTGGWPAVKDLLVRLIRVKVHPIWYLTALLLPVFLVALVVVLAPLVGDRAEVGVAVSTGSLLGLFALNIWMWLITEETAWRGFALPRLQERFNPLIASIVLGVAWALWHLPLFFIEDSFQSQIPFIGFLISTVATSVLIGWVFNRARGSVLIAALFHASSDVAIAYSGVMTSGANLFWATIVVQVLVAGAVSPNLARNPGKDVRPTLEASTTPRSATQVVV
jgi:membrane protease YdiL (CAAX protease family)